MEDLSSSQFSIFKFLAVEVHVLFIKAECSLHVVLPFEEDGANKVHCV